MKLKNILFLITVFTLLFAPPAGSAISVGAFLDATHDTGTPAVAVESTAGNLAIYGMGWHSQEHGDNYAAGGEYRLDIGIGYLGGGLVYVANRTALNGTNLNFSLTAVISGETLPLIRNTWLRRCDGLYRHMSHGANLGIEEGLANDGWNFVGGQCKF